MIDQTNLPDTPNKDLDPIDLFSLKGAGPISEYLADQSGQRLEQLNAAVKEATENGVKDAKD